VRVVVLNYNSGGLLRRCLTSVLASDWPDDHLDLVVIDNASTDGSAAVANQAKVRLIQNDSNDGFGANNLALGDLDNVDVVVLLNPDATVEPDAIRILVEALRGSDECVGAACPLITFDTPFASVPFEGDVLRVTANDVDVPHHAVGPARMQTNGESSFWRLRPGATLRVAATSDPVVVHSANGTTDVDASLGEVIIQNFGSNIDELGVGHNRGFHQTLPASGHPIDTTDAPFAWCGAAVALKTSYLRDVGLFAPEFFLYYEDTDLSWRGQSRGWSYIAVADARVQHRHSANTGQGTKQTTVLQTRNRLLALVRNGTWGQFVWAFVRLDLTIVALIGRSLVRTRNRDFGLARRHVDGVEKFVQRLPWAIRTRRQLRNRSPKVR
jgi:N-acetylglucosaminyl-diphospho-decaprenol L-rhamnosyltransferase